MALAAPDLTRQLTIGGWIAPFGKARQAPRGRAKAAWEAGNEGRVVEPWRPTSPPYIYIFTDARDVSDQVGTS